MSAINLTRLCLNSDDPYVSQHDGCFKHGVHPLSASTWQRNGGWLEELQVKTAKQLTSHACVSTLMIHMSHNMMAVSNMECILWVLLLDREMVGGWRSCRWKLPSCLAWTCCWTSLSHGEELVIQSWAYI